MVNKSEASAKTKRYIVKDVRERQNPDLRNKIASPWQVIDTIENRIVDEFAWKKTALGTAAGLNREEAKKKLTDTQWAVICTIHQEPAFRFNRDLKKIAERMEAKGWLKKGRGPHQYIVTEVGEAAYAEASKK